ncbi:MAG TPA: biopolymer transporter ExbD [Candidatus Sabulitectum sp.]|nr:biopolymer transporter ExbD [Candidatus Sabulitectum sp.]HPF31701.1 biopolymer transporter ExbD [Candidatus Sabulitectum sp.]HPJ28009.1 biopolymer transporter ExbD [Candidatus Sabulitectum sp.]HPR21199.1 biopolymer transporter ExbD [Candidatus Sabulitectum sp.]HRW77344.1 biopolymer transporter ExbD [Candidatus Sabulitectum sp.]
MAKAASGRSRTGKHLPEIDLLPVMNLFCCIIPFLLFSATFLEVVVIEMAQTEGVSSAGAGATANLMRSEEDRLQPKIIMTQQEMFIGTVSGTVHVCYAQETVVDGETIITFPWDSLATDITEVYELLDEAYPQIDFHKITILTVEEMRYQNIIRAIDIAGEAGFDQPGLQVAPSTAVSSAMRGGN